MVQNLTAANAYRRFGMMQAFPHSGGCQRASSHQTTQGLPGTVLYGQVFYQVTVILCTRLVFIRLRGYAFLQRFLLNRAIIIDRTSLGVKCLIQIPEDILNIFQTNT